MTDIYSATRTWSKDETFGLTAQVRRAAVSVHANIAEGWGRENRGSYVQFLRIAQGSLKELETHLPISERVGVAAAGSVTPFLEGAESVGKLLRLLIRKLTSSGR